MSSHASVWDRLTSVVIFLLVIAFVAGLAVWYTPVIRQNERMRREKFELEAEIAREQERSRKIDVALKSLQDPRTVERLARERLSYAKPGEMVIHFEAPAATR